MTWSFIDLLFGWYHDGTTCQLISEKLISPIPTTTKHGGIRVFFQKSLKIWESAQNLHKFYRRYGPGSTICHTLYVISITLILFLRSAFGGAFILLLPFLSGGDCGSTEIFSQRPWRSSLSSLAAWRLLENDGIN